MEHLAMVGEDGPEPGPINLLATDVETIDPQWVDIHVIAPIWNDTLAVGCTDWADIRTVYLARLHMTAFNNNLKPIVRGDFRCVERTFTGLPSGHTIDKAWLTVKPSLAAGDPGLFQIEITTSATSSGQITDASSSDGQIAMFFNISSTNSAAATGGATYFYDIQVRTTTSGIHTLAMGTVTFFDGDNKQYDLGAI
jgi:hypothetical protein